MKQKPKYKYGDKVTFDLDGSTWTGEIYIIDAYGTFERPGEPSYDIMVDNYGENKNDQCLFKHIPEYMVKPLDL